MEAIQLWVSKHKLATVGGLWASGIGASLVAYSRTRSPMKPSLRLIHARLHAQALTLAVLSGAAAYRYYENRAGEPKTQVESPAPSVAQHVQWELLSPF
ncbi:Respiratory supercomplex factor 2 [Spatholobus suberectus]|nr:Respiratory supercomplex factor 2 [Spatholobus suberectus]